MLSILQDHLSQTQTPEMLTLYMRANDLFDKFDLEDYQLAFEDLLVSADGAVDGVSVLSSDAIYNLTMSFLHQITTEHQITLSSSASMLNYIDVLEFVRQIEYTELIQECLDAVNCDDIDNLDKFSRCMLIVNSIPEEDSMLYLEMIPDCVINTMHSYFAHRVELEVITEALDPSVRDVYREMDKYARIIKGQEMLSYKYLFDEDGVVGLPFNHHYRQHEVYLLGLPLQAMVYECIGFALLSEGGLTNPQQIILESVGTAITDLDRLTRIQYEISKTLIEYRNEISSGIGLVI